MRQSPEIARFACFVFGTAAFLVSVYWTMSTGVEHDLIARGYLPGSDRWSAAYGYSLYGWILPISVIPMLAYIGVIVLAWLAPPRFSTSRLLTFQAAGTALTLLALAYWQALGIFAAPVIALVLRHFLKRNVGVNVAAV